MYVRVMLNEKSLIVSVPSIGDSIGHLKSAIRRKLNISRDNDAIRLFRGGQELKEEFSLLDYQLRLNDVIQAYVTPATHGDKCYTGKVNRIIYANEGEYFRVGELVDVPHPQLTGTWFLGKVKQLRQASVSATEEARKWEALVQLMGYENDLYWMQETLLRPPVGNATGKVAGDFLRGKEYLIMTTYKQNGEKKYWYAIRLDCISRKRTKFILSGTLLLSRSVEICNFKVHLSAMDEILEITFPNNVALAERCQELETYMRREHENRKLPIDCIACADDPISSCRSCSCCVCGGKDGPERQLICDECARAWHTWCLQYEVDEKEEFWYCHECQEERKCAAEMIAQRSHPKRRRNGQEEEECKGRKKWGFGMACVGRTERPTLAIHHIGPVESVPVGTWLRFRFQVSELGLHRPLVARLHFSASLGQVYSLVFQATHPLEIDLGERIYLVGQDAKPTRKAHSQDELKTKKKRAALPLQSSGRLSGLNMALVKCCPISINSDFCGSYCGSDWRDGLAIRVLRTGNSRSSVRSPYAPPLGIRYDGIYKVKQFWRQHFSPPQQPIWRFELRRDDPSPAAWTKEGRRRLTKGPIYPSGYAEADETLEERRLAKRLPKRKGPSTKSIRNSKWFKRIEDLAAHDDDNEERWRRLLNDRDYHDKESFLTAMRDEFRCPSCLAMISIPVVTLSCCCGVNICRECLAESRAEKCLMCRKDIRGGIELRDNDSLGQILLHVQKQVSRH